nr:N-acetylmuramoyl-L-alanine amidase [uncultured Romboutsia sp.]
MISKTLKKIAAASILTTILASNFTISNAASHKVFIDAGHGGKDNGSNHNSYFEDAINLQIAKKLENKLIDEGIKVEMSRKNDTYLSLSKRAIKSNNSDSDMFISIHQNSSLNKNANGIETYYMGDKNKSLATTIHKNVINYTNANNRNVRKGNFQVLRDNKKPSILLECGFISNPTEAYRLNNTDYQDKLVNGIVAGIKKYFNISDSSKYATALNTVNIMSDRGKNFKIIGTLPKGTKVKVIDTKFDWHKIKYNGRYGYVSGVYVK